jgi:hypothetical protein
MRDRKKRDRGKEGGECRDEKSQVLSIWLHNAIAVRERTCDTSKEKSKGRRTSRAIKKKRYRQSQFIRVSEVDETRVPPR